MMLRLIALFVVACCLAPIARAQTAQELGSSGDWKAYSYIDPTSGGLVCFVSSAPKQMEGDYDKRGPAWLQITHRQGEENAANRVNVVTFAAGFTFWDQHQPVIRIGDQQFRMHTENETAWSFPADDSALTRAMRDGASLFIESKSWRGTEIRDTFSLRGITAMHNRISEECGFDPL